MAKQRVAARSALSRIASMPGRTLGRKESRRHHEGISDIIDFLLHVGDPACCRRVVSFRTHIPQHGCFPGERGGYQCELVETIDESAFRAHKVCFIWQMMCIFRPHVAAIRRKTKNANPKRCTKIPVLRGKNMKKTTVLPEPSAPCLVR